MIFRPYKSDIRQVESLVKLGCNYDDIASILGITPSRLKAWERNTVSVAEALKPKARPEYTLTHPEYAPMVEEAFNCGGKRFYRFKEEYRMSTGRYKYYYSTLRELELKLSLKDLEKFIEVFETILNGGSKQRDIKMGDLWKMLFNLKSRVALAFDLPTIKRLAAVSYFDETEDLTTFSEKYGEEKIKLWENHNVEDFFLTRLIGELYGLKNFSPESLELHLREMEAISKELDSSLQTVLKDNS